MPIDLNKLRQERAAKRAVAAEREARTDGEPIILDGKEIAVLPPELPWDAIKPFRQINDEIALLLRQALQMQKGGQTFDGFQLVLDLLATNPKLPQTLIDVVTGVAEALLGKDGLAALFAEKLSLPDVLALVQGVFAFYGTNLGESSRSVDSSASDGPKSEPTSSGTTTSTPEVSSAPLVLPASSESPTSSTS